eukprot:12641842-Heterocapsa_arctica.AAC.1
MSSQFISDVALAVDTASLEPALQTVYKLHQFFPVHVTKVHDHQGQDCVLNIWEAHCTQPHAPIFRHFPPVQD